MSYKFIPISLIVIIVYAITYVLYKENVITEAVHAKIWSILILIIGLILAAFGLLITLFAEYGISIPINSDMVFWHVEIGIVLFIIALFHIHLHWDRFKIITLRI
jgi:hydrogenase-4 membrane subunit HyfE